MCEEKHKVLSINPMLKLRGLVTNTYNLLNTDNV